MPQLKKVVLSMGDRLIYRDTFDEALADLTGMPAPARPAQNGSCFRGRLPLHQPAPKMRLRMEERLHALHDQAEQLTRELEKLEKEAGKK